MSTLEGAVPIGLGITKLRLWDELHRAHCETMQQESHASSSRSAQGASDLNSATATTSCLASLKDLCSSRLSQLYPPHNDRQDPAHVPSHAKKRRVEPPASLPPADTIDRSLNAEVDQTRHSDYQNPISDWFMSSPHGVGCSTIDDADSTSSKVTGAMTDNQGVLIPPPPPKPGPTRRKPPPLVARIRAKARRAKRKQQKAEYRRRLFLAHLVQVTREARQRNARKPSTISSSAVRITKTLIGKQAIQQAWVLFPECHGVDLTSFVETVFDTDVQSSEITPPSEISDDDLAIATRTEIENRKRLGGADVKVAKGVFRWMVARDFAQRWPQKMQHVRDNPWPGLEHVWGSPSSLAHEQGEKKNGDANGEMVEEPFRWQSGRRSRFIRKKEGKVSKGRTAEEESSNIEHTANSTSGVQKGGNETVTIGIVRSEDLADVKPGSLWRRPN
ncbi:hypothetical protein EX895_004917 [Sporisorium graminicola]|uniref:Uncharacterized protein n=1 Tax=Sporisorium graminicola TaxID=280036 RepID=A0A4U7KSX3_9BASI|nr:hypothetical protein EX895_004917 [Sporisorium graminicola]TKY86092.1 hypothetical protein EX895_004917 [Sporisorium graminicola]